GKTQALDPEEVHVDAITIQSGLANIVEHLLLDFGEFNLLRIAGDEVRKSVLTDDRLFSEADRAFELRFGGFGSAGGEAVEEFARLFNGPADINARQNIIAVGGEHLVELVFEAVNALVEAIDALNRERPFEIKAGLRDRFGGRLGESRDK